MTCISALQNSIKGLKVAQNLFNMIGQTLIIYLHKNVPGILSNVNRVLQKYNININNLNLTTKDNLGYCLIRIDKQSDNTKKIIQDEINNFSETIRLRFR